MLHISPDSLATLSAPKAKAAALAAHAAAFNDPNTDWRALAEVLAVALAGKPRAVASEAGDKPPVWWCDGAIKRRGGSYERGRFSVLFADGQTVRCNVHREVGKPWLVAKAVRVAVSFYRARIGDYSLTRAVPDMLLVENTTAGTIHDAAICNSLTSEIRAASLPPQGPSKGERLIRAERLALLARAKSDTGKLQQALAYMDARDADTRDDAAAKLRKSHPEMFRRGPSRHMARHGETGRELRREGDASLEAWEYAASGLRTEAYKLASFDDLILRHVRHLAEGPSRSRVYDYREAEIPVPSGPRARVHDRPSPRSRVQAAPAVAWAYEWVQHGSRGLLEPRGENPLASAGRLAVAGPCRDGFMAMCRNGRGIRSTIKRDLFAAMAWAVETLRAGGFTLESPSPGVVEPEFIEDAQEFGWKAGRGAIVTGWHDTKEAARAEYFALLAEHKSEPEPEPPTPTPPAPKPAKRKAREPAAILPPPVVAFGEAGPVVALRVGPDGNRARAKLLGVFAGFGQAWEAMTGKLALVAEAVAHGPDFAECRINRSPDNVRFELRRA